MSLSAGAHLGPYEILGSIGAGGMGEVYRALDTRLNRQVAIKTLPEHLAERPDLRERFEREARAVSLLNHPHICTLYDIGRQDGIEFIVMELVEGETLAERLLKGPLPVDQVLRYSAEVADALDKAHRHGVVHRDLKPGNLMLTKSGSKLLDFGLAKVAQPAGFHPLSADGHDSRSGSAAPVEGLTVQGAMLGTLNYMAPEQLEGREADPRSDIFSLGVLIYEMLTGRKAFQGKSQAGIVAAILDRDPAPISSVQSDVPAALDRVVKRCLAKDPDDRWQSAGDLANELQWLAEDRPAAIGKTATLPETVTTAPTSKRRDALPWSLAAAFLVTTVFFAIHYFNPPAAPSAAAVRFTLATPPSNAPGHIALSPDGRNLAYLGRTAEGAQGLWVRTLSEIQPRYLAGTESALHPFWSPDSRSVGFFAGGKLKKADIASGSIQTITDAPGGVGGTWNRDGVVVFTDGSVLRTVSSSGGGSTAITTLDTNAKETQHLAPFFLPDGRHYIYLRRTEDTSNSAIFAGALDSADVKKIFPTDNIATYAAPGYLFAVQDDTLMARPFDPARLEVTGEAFPLAQRIVGNTLNNRSGFGVSDSGVLALRNTATDNSSLTWFSRTGRRLSTIGSPGQYFEWSLSPDGKTIAVEKRDSPVSSDLWLTDVERGSSIRFTFGPGVERDPLWSNDGGMLRFSVGSPGRGFDIYQKPKSGAGEEQVLVKSGAGLFAYPEDQFGQLLIYRTVDTKTNADLWILPLDGDRKPAPYLQAPSRQVDAQVSRDGKWLAYVSDETGKYEVYVESFPTAGAKRQVSVAGGHMPRWRSDGKELFYISLAGKMTAVPITGATLEFGAPQPLFDVQLARTSVPASVGRAQYAVSRDGQRFLINTAGENTSDPITIVINWLKMGS